MRKIALFLILFGIALTFLMSSPGKAEAQTFSCIANSSVPPVVRAEGLAELVGDLILSCTGTGTAGNANFQLFLNTSVTSRLLASPASEALLMIDDPLPGSQVLNTNVFQGRWNSGNSILWENIPVNPPGAGGTLVFRIKNVRVHAAAIGAPGQIQGLISATGTISIPISSPTQMLAFTQAGGNSFSVTSSRFDQEIAPGMGGNPTGFTLTFREGFPNAFKKKIEGTDQDLPGSISFTESGFTSSVMGNAGRADTGTRLIARFAGVPVGVTLSVPSEVAGSAPGSTAVLVSVTDLNGMGGSAQSPIPPPGIVTLAGGTGAATWEITNTSPLVTEEFSIPVTVSYTPNPGAGIPGLGTATVSTNFAPISTVTTASSTAPLPRFTPPAISQPAFTIFRRAVFNDFDGDRKSDIVIYRSGTGTWYIYPSGGGLPHGVGWGISTDTPVSADYDGDGMADIAVYRTGTGTWYVIPSSGGAAYGLGWGGDATDKPVPADYDGDGMADYAIYRNGTWFVHPSRGGTPYAFGWGIAADKPVPGDYDGDRMTDCAVYRDGMWFVNPSGGGAPYAIGWGIATDKPVPGDYDGDGKTDYAVYRGGAWFVYPSGGGTPYGVGWGINTDKPVPGDYDGDGEADIAVYRGSAGVWYVIPSSGGTPYGIGWGGDPSDIPVTSNPA